MAAAGGRILYISNEHPELLERCMPDPALKPKVERGRDMLRRTKVMHVTSEAGTDLTIDVDGAAVSGRIGIPDAPGTLRIGRAVWLVLSEGGGGQRRGGHGSRRYQPYVQALPRVASRIH